jgi:hypothetical protein
MSARGDGVGEARDAQTAAEDALEAYLYSGECDCVTCIVREVLTAADPFLCQHEGTPRTE